MIYLILQMFVYLLLAGIIGGAAGWLLRNLQAQQSEEQARRQVTDAKSKVPQLESLLRGRDEQVTKLKNEIRERRKEHKELVAELKACESKLLEQKREANSWKQKAEAKKEFALDDENDDATDTIIAELSQEIVELKERLASAATPQSVESSDKSNGQAEEAFAEQQAELVKQQEVLMAELDATRLQNSRLEKEMKNARADLLRQSSAVRELERERELQNKSLQVMHQQLELERSNRLASG